MAKGPDPMFGARLSLEMAGGVLLQDAIREAVRVAAKAGRLVHFVFNGVALCAQRHNGSEGSAHRRGANLGALAPTTGGRGRSAATVLASGMVLEAPPGIPEWYNRERVNPKARGFRVVSLGVAPRPEKRGV